MLEYVGQIRVSIELVLTLLSLWWTIRKFALASIQKDQLGRDEDDAHQQLDNLASSARKIEDAAKKIRDRVIPGQASLINQLRGQLVSMEKDLEKTQLPAKVQLYREVKQFYTEQPKSRYFRASDWAPTED